jgi:hypothetical protein
MNKIRGNLHTLARRTSVYIVTWPGNVTNDSWNACLTLRFIWPYLGRAANIRFTNVLHINKSRVFLFSSGALTSKPPVLKVLSAGLSLFLTGADCSFSFVTSRRTEYRLPSRTVYLILRLFVTTGTCLRNYYLAMNYSPSIFAAEMCVDFVAGRCLAMDSALTQLFKLFRQHTTFYMYIYRQGNRQTAFRKTHVGIEILTALVMKCTVFWDAKPCDSLKVNRRFGGTYSFYIHGRRINRVRNCTLEASGKIDWLHGALSHIMVLV